MLSEAAMPKSQDAERVVGHPSVHDNLYIDEAQQAIADSVVVEEQSDSGSVAQYAVESNDQQNAVSSHRIHIHPYTPSPPHLDIFICRCLLYCRTAVCRSTRTPRLL